VINLINRVL